MDQIYPPSEYQIPDAVYIGGEEGCCVCSGWASQIALLQKSRNTNTANEFLEAVLPYGKDKNIEGMFSVVDNYNLKDKLNVGYLYQNESDGSREEYSEVLNKYLDDYQKQVHLISNQNEALDLLKKVVYLDYPMLAAFEKSDQSGSVAEEVEDNIFVLVVGYDADKVIYYTLPDIKTSDTTDSFISKWELQDSSFKYPIILGSYTMMFFVD